LVVEVGAGTGEHGGNHDKVSIIEEDGGVSREKKEETDVSDEADTGIEDTVNKAPPEKERSTDEDKIESGIIGRLAIAVGVDHPHDGQHGEGDDPVSHESHDIGGPAESQRDEPKKE
jgi:hypothetical protein